MAEKDDELEDIPVGQVDDPNFMKTVPSKEAGVERIPRTPRNRSSSSEKSRGKKSKRSSKERRESKRYSSERKESKRTKVASEEERSDLQVEINAQGIKSNKNDMLWQNYGGRKQIHILNKTESIHAVKIRCSDNTLFQITPPMTSIQPFETVNIGVRRFKTPIKPDKINILVTPTARVERHLKELFASPYLPVSKLTIKQQVEENPNEILAYFTPCAPAGKPCLKFDKVKLIFNKVGGDQRLRVTNNLPNRIGIKVQCTDNFLYKFKPIFTIMERKESLRFKISRNPHPKKRDKMVICTTVVKKQSISDLPDYFDKKGLKITEIHIPLTCT
ncbi:unnamed protein product [Cylicocyclus nassatus]|uniref:Major sperm protein n=1 Tax=Cylicocyclus nassatus TaxID=53992 RepID=A0AA36GIK5_CYLNA|nr:unnamed protein product [Cylicocyclus nassatus]